MYISLILIKESKFLYRITEKKFRSFHTLCDLNSSVISNCFGRYTELIILVVVRLA